MFNKVIIVGNLTRDVELKLFQSGASVATIGLASNRKQKKQDGTMAEEVCYVDVKLFGKTAQLANQYLKKGSRILIEGRLAYETWADQSGAKRSRHVIIAEGMTMLGSLNEPRVAPVIQEDTKKPSTPSTSKEQIPDIDIDEDRIPF